MLNRVYWMVVKSVFGDLIGYRYMFFRGGKFIYVGYDYMEDEVYIWKVDEYCTLFDTVISEIDVRKMFRRLFRKMFKIVLVNNILDLLY